MGYQHTIFLALHILMKCLQLNGMVCLEEELSICLEAHRPKQFIFDGAFPYRGMLNAIKSRPELDSTDEEGNISKRESIPSG